MLDCLILGDSIAVGTAQFKTECVSYAQVGITSRKWNDAYITKDLSAKTVTISLGSNDGGSSTFKELLALRQNISADKVFWILPAVNPAARDAVKIIAASYKDTTFEIPELSKDKVHPTVDGYKQIARKIK